MDEISVLSGICIGCIITFAYIWLHFTIIKLRERQERMMDSKIATLEFRIDRQLVESSRIERRYVDARNKQHIETMHKNVTEEEKKI
jgi:hypothetical protein